MPTTTLAVLRQALGDKVSAIRTFTTSGAGVVGGTTVVATGLKKWFRSNDAATNKWVLITSGDCIGQWQMCTAYTYADGTLTTEAFSAQIAASVTGEVWDFEPAMVNKAIAKASQDLFPDIFKAITSEVLTAHENMQVYKLPTTLIGGPRRVYLENPIGWDFEENLLDGNGGFEDWSSSSQPATWSAATGITLSKALSSDNMPVKYGVLSCKSVVAASTAASLYQSISNPANYAGQELTFAAWIYSKVATRINVRIYDDVGGTDSTAQHGGTGWQLLYVTHTVTVAPTTLYCGFKVSSGVSFAMYLDDCYLTRGNWYPEKFWDELNGWTYDRASHLLRLQYALSANRCLRLESETPVTEVSADTDTVEIGEPYVQLVLALAIQKLYEMLNAASVGSSDAYAPQVAYWRATVAEERARHSMSHTKIGLNLRRLSQLGNY